MLPSFPSWVLETLQERQERHEYPMWVTDKLDPYNRYEVLKEQLGCDPPAMAKFNLLNQCTNKGPYAANNVLAAMLKKEQDAFNPLA